MLICTLPTKRSGNRKWDILITLNVGLSVDESHALKGFQLSPESLLWRGVQALLGHSVDH